MIKTGIQNKSLPIDINLDEAQWVIAGGGNEASEVLNILVRHSPKTSVTLYSEQFNDTIRTTSVAKKNITLLEKNFDSSDPADGAFVVIATGNRVVDQKMLGDVKMQNRFAFAPAYPELSDFTLSSAKHQTLNRRYQNKYWLTERSWKQITSRMIMIFLIMIIGHIVISYLPVPSVKELWVSIKPHFSYQFLFFIMAGFLAQLVDGVLSMGYGVTSATCLMTFGVNPVAMSASIHTSEIFTTGISGYSHYRFGNVNKKLFKLLVIPGVLGAVLGAILLVYLGEQYGHWLMPVIALYAGFLGLRIMFKAFKEPTKGKKVKRLGWLAGAGGFFDSFGGGGWGPLVTSNLLAKGRSPKYTVGSVSLTEFFVTLASAFTFFITVGVSHWNIVLGLLIGGSIAAPLGARLAGKLPRKTMMIAVGVMVIIWSIRMIIKSL